jgi:transposase
MAARYVKPYVKTNKNDWIDAEAIAEAVQSLLTGAFL